jgi:hypothetical protein
VSRLQGIALLGAFVALLAGAYFATFALKPQPIARILMRRGYEQRGWTEERLTSRVRLLGSLGVILALAAILLAIVKFVG